MILIKKWVKNFFGFSRSEVNGFVVLLPLVAVILFSEPLWHWWISQRAIDAATDRKKLDSLVAIWSLGPTEDKIEESVPKQHLFTFNPNMADADDLVALGFSQQLASRIVNYRIKGGRFRIKSDLLKIYGIDSAFYQRVYPFVLLPESITAKEKTARYAEAKKFQTADRAIEKFDLNQADTSQLKKIHGIGDKLSLRIIKYRDILGGFVDMDQLKEVYGLDSLVIARLKENSMIQEEVQLKKININTASEKQLSSHPYLTKMAKAIVSYRFQHGNFQTVQDIRNVNSVDEKFVQRVIPYLKVNDDL